MPYRGPERRRDIERRTQVDAILRSADHHAKVRHRRERVTEIIRNLAIVLVIAFVWTGSWLSRNQITNNTRAACLRSTDSYLTNAQAWRNDASNWNQASDARRKDGDTAVADVYAANASANLDLAQHLEFLAGAIQIDKAGTRGPSVDLKAVCAGRFPKASFLSFGK